MLVTSAQHNEFEGQDTGCVTATIDGVEMNVPKNTDNRHWQAVQKWVADGNTIAEAD
tara:strand:+ start:436 stop:606 length:171 start_codon:yes stop_codon:yes gene_type:complete